MSEKHIPYQDRFNRREDFRLRYRFYTLEEGGRMLLPDQGVRLNFWYENNNHTQKGQFMIWPEFEDEEIIESGVVLNEGIARMWIVSNELRTYHRERLTIKTKGYFMEGVNKVAEIEIFEFIGLNQ